MLYQYERAIAQPGTVLTVPKLSHYLHMSCLNWTEDCAVSVVHCC